MWLVTKQHDGTEPDRQEIPAAIFEPMVRWYVGQGDEADEKIGVALVHKAKMFERWLACACLGDAAKPPLLSPAYLSEAETFYLRRLTGESRPEHHVDCPFHRDQTLVDRDGRPLDPKPLVAPTGYFAALKPLGEHLAQQPVDDADDNRVRGASVPRLARLLWLLLDSAGTNIVDAPPARERPSMSHEFERVRAAANGLFTAPGKPLGPVLFTHARALHSNHIYARLRAAAATWPEGYEPQAFLLTYAQSVGRREILLKDQDPIIVATDIARPPLRQVSEGPFLVFVAIGEHAQARGLAPVRAYAQPILSGRHFVPLFADAERVLLDQLQRFQWDAAGSRIAVRIKRPLFDIESDEGPIRPTCMLDISGPGGADRRLHFVQLRGLTAEEDGRLDAFGLDRLRGVAPVTIVTGDALADQAHIANLLMPMLLGRDGST
jgi:hypothetical protein